MILKDRENYQTEEIPHHWSTHMRVSLHNVPHIISCANDLCYVTQYMSQSRLSIHLPLLFLVVLTHLPWTKWPLFHVRYFQIHFVNENVRISIKISLEFVHKVPIDNKPTLVQIMAWRRPGDKPLSEPMMVSLPTHICITRPQWLNEMRAL